MSVEYNSQLATRQTEINEWSYNNKMDTLFVFQLLFISMLIICILMMFSYQGTIGRPFVWYTFSILVFIDILVIINRSMYTNQIRDKKQWDKVIFPGDQKTVSPKGKDPSYIAKLDAVHGENGVQLSAQDTAGIIASTATTAALAEQYGVSQDRICAIRTNACSNSCRRCS
jgi:FlaA1/EpsC-like NDP-sugar epimerase